MGVCASKANVTIVPAEIVSPKEKAQEEIIYMNEGLMNDLDDIMSVLKENDHIITPRLRQDAIIDAPEGPAKLRAISSKSPKSLETTQLIRMSLKTNPVFQYNMDEVQLLHIIEMMSYHNYVSGTIFTSAGKSNHYFYCLESGLVEMRGLKDDGSQVVIHIKPGQGFGEIFIFDNPCLFTTRALEDSILWVLDRKTFKKALISSEKEKLKKRVQFLRTVPLFDSFTMAQYNLVAESGQTFYYKDREVIVTAGDQITNNSFFYIVMEGKVEVKVPPLGMYFEQFGYKQASDNEITISIGPGQVVGERALFANEPRNCTIIADGDVCLLGFNKESLSSNVLITLIKKFQDVYGQYEQAVLTEIPFISMLNTEDQQALCSHAEPITFEAEEVILKQGDIPTYAYIIMDGEIVQKKTKSDDLEEVRLDDQKKNKKSVLIISSQHSVLESIFDTNNTTLTNGDFFGYKLLIENKPADTDYVAVRRSFCVRLSKQVVQKYIIDKLAENKVNRVVHDLVIRNNKSSQRKKEIVEMKTLKPITILGKGSYGTVYLCFREDGKECAVKSISKKSILTKEEGLRASSCSKLMRELDILRSLPDISFFVYFYGTSADQDNLYFVMEYVSGCELFHLMYDANGQNHTMKEPIARFFIANIVIMLNTLHSEKIVYRDLKPENVMYNKNNGYLKLIDFGFSKHVLNRTFSLCGTPLYTAPEVLSCSGHNVAADWWSLGVICYEMLYGFTPFRGKKCFNTFTNILKKDPYFPENKISPDATSLIGGLLNKKYANRLGSGHSGYSNIMNHPWFKEIDWELLYNQKLEPPFKYDVTDNRSKLNDLPQFGESKPIWVNDTALEAFIK